jgi:hypothetical protein
MWPMASGLPGTGLPARSPGVGAFCVLGWSRREPWESRSTKRRERPTLAQHE